MNGLPCSTIEWKKNVEWIYPGESKKAMVGSSD
jgi:hypothetical protein